MADFFSNLGNALGQYATTATQQAAVAPTISTPQLPAFDPGSGTGWDNQPAAQPGITAPAVTSQDPSLNYIAKNESGSNPSIGYHYAPDAQGNRTSTAFGTYGITAPAYKDIQAADPYFANKDISSLTPDDQTRAAETLKGVYARQLQAQGVDPTPANINGAWVLGAAGQKKFLETGTVSPQAAALNGGAEKLTQTVQNRMAGAPSPSSGAANPENQATQAPQPTETQQPNMAEQQMFTGQGLKVEGKTLGQLRQEGQDWKALSSKDPSQLVPLLNHSNPALAAAASDHLYDIMRDKRMSELAQSKVNADLAQGRIPDINKQKGEEGSYIKAYLFALLGLTNLSKQEQEKISPTKTTRPVMIGNEHYAATYDKNGELLYAKNEQGQMVDDATKAKIAANAFGTKGIQTGQTMGYDKAGNVISHSILPNGQVRWKNETTNTILSSAPEGYHTGKDQQGALADTAYKQSLAADEAENRKQFAATKTNLYTPAQMEARAQEKRNKILGLSHPGGDVPTTTTTTTTTTTSTATLASTATAPLQQAGTALADSALEAQAQSIARGETKMPTGMGANNRRAQALQNRVYELDPNFDPTRYDKMKKTEDVFNTGKQGEAVKSMNVAIDHLDTLQQAANALNNGNMPLFNKIGNLYATNTGQTAPGSFDAVKTIVGSEVAKAIAGGATALGDREEIRKEINNAKSPQQLAQIIQKYQQLLSGQVKGLHQEFIGGHGRQSEWDNKLTPRTKEILEGKPAGTNAGPGPYQDTSKEQRYQEWLKKHPEFQGNK